MIKLGGYVPISELHLQPGVSTLFHTAWAITWELRDHRAEYAKAGALSTVARRLYAHPETFLRVALEIGKRRSTERNSRSESREPAP